MGRKRKTGKREANGRLVRAKIDKGNGRTEAKIAAFGQNGSDAIGRAFESGLLGSGQDAKALLDTARAISRAYWAAYERGPIRCTLADRSSGGVFAIDDERDRRKEDWLRGMIGIANVCGTESRKLFDELVVDINPDHGPAWLDRLVEGGLAADDWSRLACAVERLSMCAGIVTGQVRKTA
jgi:hypothetical protein